MSRPGKRDPVVDRLDAAIRLMLEDQRDKNEDITVGDQILVLEDAGLSPAEAGKILGIDSGQLTKYIKKAKNKKLKIKLEKKKGKSKT